MRFERLPAVPMLLLWSRLAIAATGLLWLGSGDGPELGVAVVALVLTLLPARLVRESALRGATAAVLALLLAAHVVLGMHGGLYETSAVYDKAMHALGSAAVAALAAFALRGYCARRRIDLPTMPVCLLVLGATLSAGTLWEMFEFAIDRTGLFRAQRGLQDTMLDLVANGLGAVLVVAVLTSADLTRRSLARR